jgi:hypothetical protein
MKISECPHAPEWLTSAKTENADVEWTNGYITWNSGDFLGGDFLGGNFRGGNFRGGDFLGGDFLGGNFLGGDFLGGNFLGGNWRGGWWYGSSERLLFTASSLGIVPDDDGMCVAYRTTLHDGHGRHNHEYIQTEGEYYEDDIENVDDAITCTRGIHVTTAARAYVYFGVDPTAQMWRVRFHICNLIACDGEKARISGGIFEKMETPF